MEDSRTNQGRPIARELEPLDPGHCYHCETKAVTNTYCEVWRVWSCTDCLKRHHRAHHNDCRLEVPKALTPAPRNSHFRLYLTHYDGRPFSVLCRLGQKLEMQDHWLGTYIFFPDQMILCRETREIINKRILDGLQSA
jgi:hypothetical protein